MLFFTLMLSDLFGTLRFESGSKSVFNFKIGGGLKSLLVSCLYLNISLYAYNVLFNCSFYVLPCEINVYWSLIYFIPLYLLLMFSGAITISYGWLILVGSKVKFITPTVLILLSWAIFANSDVFCSWSCLYTFGLYPSALAFLRL